MGCSFSIHQKVMDSSSHGSQVIDVLDSAETLLKYFENTSKGPKKCAKCIFVFGGPGSNKGEFIWELMKNQPSRQPENLVTNSEDRRSSIPVLCARRAPIVFKYIDVEKLVAANIKRRIRELVRESNFQRGNHLLAAKEADERSSSTECDYESDHELDEEEESCNNCDEEKENLEDLQIEKIKPYLVEFANVVTCNWVLRLIQTEIRKRKKKDRQEGSWPSSSFQERVCEEAEPEVIYLVTMIPNRVNLFRKCLYLNQTPNLVHAPFDFFALNLTKVETEPKKDLDLVSAATSFQEEANNNFVKYFRSINKLVEFRITETQKTDTSSGLNGLKIRVTRRLDHPDVLVMQNVPQLKLFLTQHAHNQKETNLASRCSKLVLMNVDQLLLQVENSRLWVDTLQPELSHSPRLPRSPSTPLVFFLENKVEFEEHKVTIEVEDEEKRDVNAIRPFINCVRQLLHAMTEGSEMQEMNRKTRSRSTGNEDGMQVVTESAPCSNGRTQVRLVPQHGTERTTPRIVINDGHKSDDGLCSESSSSVTRSVGNIFRLFRSKHDESCK